MNLRADTPSPESIPNDIASEDMSVGGIIAQDMPTSRHEFPYVDGMIAVAYLAMAGWHAYPIGGMVVICGLHVGVAATYTYKQIVNRGN